MRWRWRCAAFGCRLEILTDNGKVFTDRFGHGIGEVLFDRICRENGIKHFFTRPAVADHDREGGAVAQDVMRAEFMNGKVFAGIDDAQVQLDAWVHHYNHHRPHQSLGMATPSDRFKLDRTDAGTPGRRARG